MTSNAEEESAILCDFGDVLKAGDISIRTDSELPLTDIVPEIKFAKTF